MKDLISEWQKNHFELINSRKDNWKFRGRTDYFFPIKPIDIIIDLIKETKQEELSILDIGAGNGEWAQSLAKQINEENQILSATIYSITGENYPDQKQTLGKCTLIYIGGFFIENIDKEFEQRNINVKFDFIISSWCFRHLINPVATLIKSYNMLNNSGYILLDGFYISINSDIKDPIKNMITFFKKYFPQVLILNDKKDGRLNSFFIKANDKKEHIEPISTKILSIDQYLSRQCSPVVLDY